MSTAQAQSSSAPAESAFARLKQHPRGFWFIFWGELAERASFYGMRTVLAFYLTSVLAFSKNDASTIMPAFIAACYIAPLLGGWIADRVLGRYKTILYFSGPYVLGHIILGGVENRVGLFVALVLLALGSGSIKPNTSTLMGAMYEEQKKSALLTEAFSYFYAAINIGSTIATLGLPWIRDYIAEHDKAALGAQAALERGYAVALMIPAALMVVAFGFFAIGKKHYPVENVRSQPPKTQAQRAAERATLARIAGVFATIVIFWFVYDESASTWIYFANDHMKGIAVGEGAQRIVNLELWSGVSVTADQIQGLNPILIVILTPIFNAIWEHYKRKDGVGVPDTRKMLLGFFIVIGCMALMAICGYIAQGDTKVSVWWMCIATFVITMAELCISVVGLEFAFKQAAPGTKSTVTGAFLFTVFVGDFIQTLFNKAFWDNISPGHFFAIQTAICVVAAVAFIAIARRFERGEAVNAPPAVAEQA
ncbi:MAG TPA: oligopeptide:H+ symporter [Minicystis sp.]|nr:oligopeptide:H+ symporter [Minicystis sp.]